MNYHTLIAHLINNRELSIKKAQNLSSNLYRFYKKNPHAGIYPSLFFIEPTNICNLKCPLCPTGNNSLTREKGFMSFDCFKKIIDEIADYAIHISLWNYGEPLCHTGIYDMIGYVKQKNIFTRLSTNGSPLGLKEARAIVQSKLDHLIVCLDGASQNTLSTFRIGSDFDKIIYGLQAIIADKRRVKTSLPHVELQFIAMRHNEHEIKTIKKIARQIKVDSLRIKTVSLQIEKTKEVKEKVNTYLPTQDKNSRYKTDTDRLQLKQTIKNRCLRLSLSTVINFNGDVVPCCNDPNGTHTFGNILDTPLIKIWNSSPYIDFRKQVLDDKKNMPLCECCTGTFWGKSVN